MSVADQYDDEDFASVEEWEDEVEIQAGFEEVPVLEGFALVVEDRPVRATRAPAKPKELAWEQFLAFLRDTPGKTVRVFNFTGEDAAKAARARARSMRARLVKTQPEEMWEITADEIKDDGSWRVYASYEGPADPETVADRARIHEERVARGHAVAAARFSG